MFNPDEIRITPPVAENPSFTQDAVKKIRRSAVSDLLNTLLEGIAENSDNEASRAGARIMLASNRTFDAIHRISRFADPSAEDVPDASRIAAAECLEFALASLNGFLNTTVEPKKTMFDK